MKNIFKSKEDLSNVIASLDEFIIYLDNYEKHIKQVGKLCRVARQLKGLSQMDIAKEIGVKHHYIAHLELGTITHIDIEILALIAAYLDPQND